MKVKICGITNTADALACVEAGADMLGFIMFPKSARYIERSVLKTIIDELPDNVLRVGVYVNEPIANVHADIENGFFDILQFHGSETPDYCAKFENEDVFKAMHIMNEKDLGLIDSYKVQAFVLDSKTEKLPGGTGIICDWSMAKKAQEKAGCVILSGGLTQFNVAEAIQTVNPYGVDVSTGVEKEPGIKDHDKIKEFIRIAKTAYNA
ncbi:MAG: phosphoribosylanthranilate isomerase [Elusimicrobiota bacterium]